MKESDIHSRLRQLRTKIKSDKLIGGSGLGNEVNYHIFDYDPKDESAVNAEIVNMQQSLSNIKNFNIYELIISLLKEKNYLEKSFTMEQAKGSDSVNKATMRALKTDHRDSPIIKHIMDNISDGDIILLTGIGSSHQIIRAHTLLANLQSVVDDRRNPVILFYPGSYDSQSLSLFNVIKAENYYRAFRLVER